MAQKHILIICGEASGDLYAASLIRAIKKISPDTKFSGVGGKLMQETGADIICDIKKITVLGLFDAIKKLPKFFSLKNSLVKGLKTVRIDAIILIDFSGFNLRFAKTINRTIPVIYYVSPQVWASRPGRIETIKRYTDKLIVLFHFEQEFYKQHGLEVEFVGHPLLDIVKPSSDKNDLLRRHGLSTSKTTLTILPGSRRQEINNILPVMLQACALISRKIKNLQVIIAKSPHISFEEYRESLNLLGVDVKIIEGETYNCVNAADFCLVASGTATLETAILQKPFIMVYKMGLLNYLLYRPQVKLPFICIVNIIAGRKIIPEFIQFRATAKNIAEETLKYLTTPSKIEEMKNNLSGIKSLLGLSGAANRAAGIITDFLYNKNIPPDSA